MNFLCKGPSCLAFLDQLQKWDPNTSDHLLHAVHRWITVETGNMDDLSPLVADPNVEIFLCNGNISANIYSTILNQNGQECILLFFLNKAFFFF